MAVSNGPAVPLHPVLAEITARIEARSRDTRAAYEARMRAARSAAPRRHGLDCSNLAHGMAACRSLDKLAMQDEQQPNLAIVSAYNDILSAHEPLSTFPALIKEAALAQGAVAQFAGGVPAMCDGVTQGAEGMELSLFSRDVIAMSTAIALSHNLFDAALCLGVCDKIVPGLLMGALSFGQLPILFVPAGPMTTGLSNDEKRRLRVAFAKGELDRKGLLAAESRAYHGPGTCTFYGTANSNQMLMEIMGLHLPGASFPNPNTPLRDALTRAAAERAIELARLPEDLTTPLWKIASPKTFVNAIVALHATGGSTNHTIHLIAMARAAGVIINWDDLSGLSHVVPLLCRIYPNGLADVNAFHAAGGVGFLVRELLDAGLLHEDVETVAGHGLRRYVHTATLEDDELVWIPSPAASLDSSVLTGASAPFAETGGLVVLEGNLGRAVIKVSAVKPEHHVVEAPALVFHSQEDLLAAFDRGELYRDHVAVVRFQGPRANGMPELHKLTPQLSIVLDKGFKVALVTDGRMSGASGKVPAAIHVTPESLAGGVLALVQDGDVIRLDARAGTLELLVTPEVLSARTPAVPDLSGNVAGMGRELFGLFRAHASGAETGASLSVHG
ncbi:MAG: phosphogluconate dehydratase [Myxococcales bacterium]|nr:phosphogluconate dehydratase [Myxococcales bacterium]